MDAFYPYDLTNLAVGPIRVLAAPREDLATLPTKIQDIIDQTSPYTPADPAWFNFGAAINPASYSSGNTQSDLTIEQDTQAVDTEITDVSRSLAFNMAEFSEAALAILEQSPGVETIAAASGSIAQKAVPFGSYSELDHFRIAFVGRRKKSAGIVHEVAADAGRGRIFVAQLYNATITGDAKTAQFAKGALAGMDVTFDEHPDPAAVAGKDGGRWIFEDAGTLMP